jgi:hypothetical protein
MPTCGAQRGQHGKRQSPPFRVALIVTEPRKNNHPARPYFPPRKTLPEKNGTGV